MEKYKPKHEVKIDKSDKIENIELSKRTEVKEEIRLNNDEVIKEARNKTEQIFSAQKSELKKSTDIEQHHSRNTHESNVKPSRRLKEVTLNNELNHIQKRLKGFDKTGSRLIHLKGFRKINDISSKTITGPYALLGGSFTAFIGSLVYYFYSNHVGIRYNYFAIILFFGIGYVAGVVYQILRNTTTAD